MFVYSLLVFPDISSWTVCQQENGDDNAHQEKYCHIEPQGFDGSVTQYLHTAIERCTSSLVAWCEENRPVRGTIVLSITSSNL